MRICGSPNAKWRVVLNDIWPSLAVFLWEVEFMHFIERERLRKKTKEGEKKSLHSLVPAIIPNIISCNEYISAFGL